MTGGPLVVHPLYVPGEVNFLDKPFGSTVKKASKKEVKARNIL
jgi:hypothetical protein